MCCGRRRSEEQQIITCFLFVIVVMVCFVPRLSHHHPRTTTVEPELPPGANYIPSDKLKINLVNKLSRDRSSNYNGATPWSQHGILGRRGNGDPLFHYSEPPGPLVNKESELREHGFYVRLSDSISLDRNVTNNRDELCNAIPDDDFELLPQTSVIFVFYNEALSTLLRSIHSVLNRSPPQLLKEIILIDDGSDKEYLKEGLERYVAKLPKVRLVRQKSRMGLVKARLRGAEEALAETFTVLDSHIEVQDGWLPPLMRRLKDNPQRVLMPMIDSLNAETLTFRKGGIGCTLGFLWTLTEHSIPIQPADNEQRNGSIDYIRSPAMAGGLFTMNRDFFWKLGGYDTDFSFWGTENLEISFRIWQCGGTLECSPCSRVYHIFRGHHPYTLPPNSVNHNKLRTAAIWMDEYAQIVKEAIGSPNVEMGPIDKMMSLRKSLECKPFSWYMKEVYPTNKFSDMREIKALGAIQNVATNKCLDSMWHDRFGQTFGIYDCHGAGGSQAFAMSRSDRHIMPLMSLEVCALPSLKFGQCNAAASWIYTNENYLKHESSNKCLTIIEGGTLAMIACDSDDKNKAWKLNLYNEHPQEHLNPIKDANPVMEAM